MPLRDHFRPPLANRNWESFAMGWVVEIASVLNRQLPEDAVAEVRCHPTSRIDFEGSIPPLRADRQPALPEPSLTVPTEFPDSFQVLVYQLEGGAKLAGVIELVSPANKATVARLRAAGTKCAGHLSDGVSVMLVDVVTAHPANLHAVMLGLLGSQVSGPGTDTNLYAVTYQPVAHNGVGRVHIWTQPMAIGQVLPTMPLWLGPELCLPVDLEATYMTTYSRDRLP
jgi:hypothetical protein